MNWTEAAIEAARNTTPERARLDTYYLFVTNAIGVVGFSVLLWDHIITFDDEARIPGWKSSGAGYVGDEMGLWFSCLYSFVQLASEAVSLLDSFQLRYFAPLGYTVQLCSYFISPRIWTPEICARYVVFEGCMTVSALGIVSLMMMIRVYALYGRSWKILAFVGALFILQFVVQGWLLSSAVPVVHPWGMRPAGCSMLFNEKVGDWATASAWLPVIYDAVIFGLTAFKTAHVLRAKHRRASRAGGGEWIMRVLLRDGSLYFFVILISNTPLMIMIAVADPGIRNVAAQWEFLITVTMMSRITLSLRREDIAWQIGTTMGDADAGQSTVYFARDDQVGKHPPHGGPGFARAKRPAGATATGSTSVASSRTAVSLAPPPGTAKTWFPPTPIVEGEADDDYLDDRNDEGDDASDIELQVPRRHDDAESDCGSARLDNMFRTYTRQSLPVNANADMYQT
ncbi:hypothetical protein AURDEDRAFT_168065 [Auricularia subglabra TFB-10046 SS5]|nr:hypothetical protein AURDEDRAFT_168065 [Auricularia subglabra TFB-10046 SS5]